MISIYEAYKRAKEESSGTLRECVELDSGWAFYFSEEDNTPGIPYVLVDKDSGEVEYLYVPPINNLKRIKSGAKVNLKIFF